jgi:hypothetical protein
MKLYLNIILIAFFSIPCLGTQTKTETVEEDGTIKTVITDEWTEERPVRGRGHGRGDTIVVMTNDDDNVEPQTSEGTSKGQDSCGTTSKTVPLKRFFNGGNLYSYSTDQQKETTLTNAGYKFDSSMGRVVPQRSDFPECHDLVPIAGMTMTYGNAGHNILLTNAGQGYLYGYNSAWSETGVIGYAVPEKGKCGATIPVRHVFKATGATEWLQITDADGEIEAYKNMDYIDTKYEDTSVIQDFYVWDENAHFCPQPRPIEKKTALVTRLFNSILTDVEYVTSSKMEDLLTKPSVGYRFDGSLGRVVLKPSDLPECKDLVAIIKMFHSTNKDHALLVDQAMADSWVKAGWTNVGVIGYGVLEKDKCGATVEIRHTFLQTATPSRNLFYGSILSQYKSMTRHGTPDGGTKNFYIWEA